MECGIGHAKDLGGFADGQQLSIASNGRNKARDIVVAPQTTDMVRCESLTVRSLSALAVENACDDIVRVMNRKPAKKRHRIFVRGWPLHLIAFQREIDLCNHAAPPA